jgi:hypothetical protein
MFGVVGLFSAARESKCVKFHHKQERENEKHFSLENSPEKLSWKHIKILP